MPNDTNRLSSTGRMKLFALRAGISMARISTMGLNTNASSLLQGKCQCGRLPGASCKPCSKCANAVNRPPPEFVKLMKQVRLLPARDTVPLEQYLESATRLLEGAAECRYLEEYEDQLVLLTQFCSLVTDTLPLHKDYRRMEVAVKEMLEKDFHDALAEIEVLRLVVMGRLQSHSESVDVSDEWPQGLSFC